MNCARACRRALLSQTQTEWHGCCTLAINSFTFIFPGFRFFLPVFSVLHSRAKKEMPENSAKELLMISCSTIIMNEMYKKSGKINYNNAILGRTDYFSFAFVLDAGIKRPQTTDFCLPLICLPHTSLRACVREHQFWETRIFGDSIVYRKWLCRFSFNSILSPFPWKQFSTYFSAFFSRVAKLSNNFWQIKQIKWIETCLFSLSCAHFKWIRSKKACISFH